MDVSFTRSPVCPAVYWSSETTIRTKSWLSYLVFVLLHIGSVTCGLPPQGYILTQTLVGVILSAE